MSFRKTLLFGALLFGLLSYIYYIEIPSEKEEANRKKFLISISADSIEAVSFKKNEASFTIENTAPKASKKTGEIEGEYVTKDSLANWKIKENTSATLEQSSLNALISSLTTLELGTPLPKDEKDSDLGSYGLLSPKLELLVKGGGKEFSLKWGKTNEYASKDYVESGGEIFLLPTSAFPSFNKEGDDFRDKSPIKFTDGDVKTIELSALGSSPVSIDRSETGEYRLIKPYLAPASDDVVSAMLRSLKGLRVSKFIDDESKSAGFKSPTLTAKVVFKDSKPPIHVAVAAEKVKSPDKDSPPTSKYFFRVNEGGSVFELLNDPTSNLIKTADGYADTKPFKVSTFLVERVEIEPKGKDRIVLEKKDSKWLVSEKTGDENAVAGYINGVSGLQAVSYVSKFGPISENPDKDYGFGDPELMLSVKLLSEVSSPAVYLVGSEAPKKMGENLVFASKSDKKDPFLLSKSSLDALVPKADALLAKTDPAPTS